MRNASCAGQVLHPAVRRDDEPLRPDDLERLADPAGDDLRRLGLGRAQVEHAQDDHLAREIGQSTGGVEVGLRRLERDVGRAAVVQLAQERVPGEPLLDDVRVAEAGVEDRVALDALERAVDRLEGVLLRRLRARLEVRLVDLDDVGAGRLEVAQLLVDGLGVREREAPPVA